MTGFGEDTPQQPTPGADDSALRRAPDAGIHPSTPMPQPIAPAQQAVAPRADPAMAMPIVGVDTPDSAAKAAKRRTQRTKVAMTKATRKQLKAQARQRGLSLKEYLAQVLETTAGHGTGSSAS